MNRLIKSLKKIVNKTFVQMMEQLVKGLFDMNEDTIVIPPEYVEVIDASEYKEELSEHFKQVPEVAKPLLKEAKTAFSKIEKALCSAPAFINAVKAAIPDVTLQAVLTDDKS